MNILITGGAGYIGSHTCLELLQAGHEIQVIDNFSNSCREALVRVQSLAGRRLDFIQGDLRDLETVRQVLRQRPFQAVIHFAGLKAVGESTERPLDYYENNVVGTLNLCRAMHEAKVRNIVFSSSATVYLGFFVDTPVAVPIREDAPLSATNPYGRTKLMIEEILRDLHAGDGRWNAVLLRYFNPVGAHPSGRIGEDPRGLPNNLMPYVSQVAVGRLPELLVFGADYPTPDGTGVRDYIHVVDLAKGHVKALERLRDRPGVVAYNLGTGRGYSVLELVQSFVRVNGVPIPYRVVGRRPGDIALYYADPRQAERELSWRAELGLEDMVRDTWRWQTANPQGY